MKRMLFAWLTLFVLTCGCEEGQELRKVDKLQAGTIGFLTRPDVVTYEYDDFNRVLVLISPAGGGLTNAISNSNRGKELTKILEAAKFDFLARGPRKIRQALADSGYQVVDVEPVFTKKKKVDYAAIDADVDVYVDVEWCFVGYAKDREHLDDEADYPCVDVAVKLVDHQGETVAYSARIRYGFSADEGVYIRCDPKYCGRDFDKMKEDHEMIVEGMEVALSSVTDKLIEGIRDNLESKQQ